MSITTLFSFIVDKYVFSIFSSAFVIVSSNSIVLFFVPSNITFPDCTPWICISFFIPVIFFNSSFVYSFSVSAFVCTISNTPAFSGFVVIISIVFTLSLYSTTISPFSSTSLSLLIVTLLSP